MKIAGSVRHPKVPTKPIVDEEGEVRRAADRILSTTSASGSDRVFNHSIVSVELSEDACDGNEEMEGSRCEGDLQVIVGRGHWPRLDRYEGG